MVCSILILIKGHVNSYHPGSKCSHLHTALISDSCIIRYRSTTNGCPAALQTHSHVSHGTAWLKAHVMHVIKGIYCLLAKCIWKSCMLKRWQWNFCLRMPTEMPHRNKNNVSWCYQLHSALTLRGGEGGEGGEEKGSLWAIQTLLLIDQPPLAPTWIITFLIITCHKHKSKISLQVPAEVKALL